MIETIIFYVLLVDAIGANLVAWFGIHWYTKHFHLFARFFPLAKGWPVLYLALVLYIGYLTHGSSVFW